MLDETKHGGLKNRNKIIISCAVVLETLYTTFGQNLSNTFSTFNTTRFVDNQRLLSRRLEEQTKQNTRLFSLYVEQNEHMQTRFVNLVPRAFLGEKLWERGCRFVIKHIHY